MLIRSIKSIYSFSRYNVNIQEKHYSFPVFLNVRFNLLFNYQWTLEKIFSLLLFSCVLLLFFFFFFGPFQLFSFIYFYTCNSDIKTILKMSKFYGWGSLRRFIVNQAGYKKHLWSRIKSISCKHSTMRNPFGYFYLSNSYTQTILWFICNSFVVLIFKTFYWFIYFHNNCQTSWAAYPFDLEFLSYASKNPYMNFRWLLLCWLLVGIVWICWVRHLWSTCRTFENRLRSKQCYCFGTAVGKGCDILQIHTHIHVPRCRPRDAWWKLTQALNIFSRTVVHMRCCDSWIARAF